MNSPWSPGQAEPAARRWALAPLVPLALAYGAGARLHRAAYDWGWWTRRRLPCRVVSVGSLQVGGAGKTPLAAWLARALRARGQRVVLASRGYGRQGREPVLVVSDGRHVRVTSARAGDEPLWLAGAAPGVPVLVGRDRGLVGLHAFSGFRADVLVLDDGFQHHRLHRDLDLVCFDGTGLGNGWTLPLGPLREAPSALARASAIGVVDGPLPERDEEVLASVAPGARRFDARRVVIDLPVLAGGAPVSVDWLRGRRVGLVTAVGRPEAVKRTLAGLDARVVATRAFRDHHRFRPRDLMGLARDCPDWVVTEKDALKILPPWVGRAHVRVLRSRLQVAEAKPFLDWIEAELWPEREGS
ncbi:MAG: tetraacyldisaccharide 4'-kinase [Proteobacteria bacterium]|nr:tetraacyldisaccharide 4'-kinase [Pseudomonadota bacterium]